MMKEPRSRAYIRQAITASAILFFAFFCLSVSASAQERDETAEKAIELFNEGQDAHEKRDYSAAIELYGQALQLMPAFPEAEFQRANAYVALGKLSDAERSFRRAVELRGDWSLAVSGLGSVLVSEGNFAAAKPVLARALDLDEQNIPALASMAELLLRTNAEPETRSELLAKITLLNSKANPNASLLAAQGSLESSLGDNTSAKKSLERALEAEPGNTGALLVRAQIALSENDIERAEHLERILEKYALNTDDAKILNARILVKRGKLSEAINVLNDLKAPSRVAEELKSQLVAANSQNAAEIEKLLTNSPNDPALLGRLCSLYRTGDPAKALEYCQRASELEPRNIEHAIGFGAALVQAKRFDEASTLFARLLTIAPDNSTIHANLATALFQLKRFSEAKPQFQWLVDHQPESPIAHYFLAITHDRLGEYLDAMANYQTFLKLADAEKQKFEIEQVTFRMPGLEKLIRQHRGKRG
jgi:tetratricopeptide (TPR) repeat protein